MVLYLLFFIIKIILKKIRGKDYNPWTGELLFENPFWVIYLAFLMN